jgi:hypothetical protein
MPLCVVATLRSTSHLGYFDNEIDAARAYDQAARKYHRRFATLNFPDIATEDTESTESTENKK